MAAVSFPSIWDLPEVDEDLLNRDLADADRFDAAHPDADMSDADLSDAEDPDSEPAAEDADLSDAEDPEQPDADLSDADLSDADLSDAEDPDAEQPAADPAADQPLETSAHTVWGRLRVGNGPTYKEVKDILERVSDKVAIAAIDAADGYSGLAKHEDIMGQLLEMPDVHGIVRVMRKLKGDHALWCFFKADGSSRVLRTGRPDGFLAVQEPIFDAPCRGSNHPAGYMSNHCFRPNFVDYVEALL
jgi:Pentapeptide repeats (8 copies)